MTTIQKKGEPVRMAVKWISEKLQEKGDEPISILICQAAGRYNLSPKEEEFLMSFYQNKDCLDGQEDDA